MGAMRALALLACAAVSAVALAASAAAAEPDTGVLSVERGKGMVALEIRGSVLGRLGTGTLRVTDLTPRDRFTPSVMGRKLTMTRLGPRAVLYRGQALRFRMLGGGYRIVVRGVGVSVSAVGRGAVVLDGEPRVPGEDVGVYSLDDGVDCGTTPESCQSLPGEPERFVLGSDEDGGQGTTK
jgi:hypothetical protein